MQTDYKHYCNRSPSLQQLQTSKEPWTSDFESTPSDSADVPELPEEPSHVAAGRTRQVMMAQPAHTATMSTDLLTVKDPRLLHGPLANNSHNRPRQPHKPYVQPHAQHGRTSSDPVPFSKLDHQPDELMSKPSSRGDREQQVRSRIERDTMAMPAAARPLPGAAAARQSQQELQQPDSSQTDHTLSDPKLDSSLAEGAAGLLAMTATAESQHKPQVSELTWLQVAVG